MVSISNKSSPVISIRHFIFVNKIFMNKKKTHLLFIFFNPLDPFNLFTETFLIKRKSKAIFFYEEIESKVKRVTDITGHDFLDINTIHVSYQI